MDVSDAIGRLSERELTVWRLYPAGMVRGRATSHASGGSGAARISLGAARVPGTHREATGSCGEGRPPGNKRVDAPPAGVRPPYAWQGHGACFGMDPETFFPVTQELAKLPLSICASCRVTDACLGWAVWWGEQYGVWGGTTEDQRRPMIRASARTAFQTVIGAAPGTRSRD